MRRDPEKKRQTIGKKNLQICQTKMIEIAKSVANPPLLFSIQNSLTSDEEEDAIKTSAIFAAIISSKKP